MMSNFTSKTIPNFVISNFLSQHKVFNLIPISNKGEFSCKLDVKFSATLI
jgi:hypothetical protein